MKEIKRKLLLKKLKTLKWKYSGNSFISKNGWFKRNKLELNRDGILYKTRVPLTYNEMRDICIFLLLKRNNRIFNMLMKKYF